MEPKGNDMSDELVERLRKLAEQATPGERELNGAGQLVIDDGPPLFELPRRTKHYTADHWFIAACSPDKILALLARLSRPSTAEAVAVARDALEAIAQLSVSEVREPREALERIIFASQECAQTALRALNGAGIRLADGTVTGGHPSPQGGAEPSLYGEPISFTGEACDADTYIPHPIGETGGTALADIAAERRRQIDAEGWTVGHDDAHGKGELARAAAAYALGYTEQRIRVGHSYGRHIVWPWSLNWWKPTDRRRDLIKAGALILAEIERLARLANKEAQS